MISGILRSTGPRLALARVSVLTLGCLLAGRAFALDYFEPEEGDLSDDYTMPTPLALDVGNNLVIASVVDSTAPGGDVDYFSIELPSGSALSGLSLEGQRNFGGDDIFFLGMVEGTAFPVSNVDATAADLLGYTLVDDSLLFRDLLPSMSEAPGAVGFTMALNSPNYSFWVQQTGTRTEYVFDFRVDPIPEPAHIALISGLLVLMFLWWKRRFA